MWVLIASLTLLHLSLCQEQYPIVNTTTGLVQGIQETSRVDGNVTYYSFKGIPFAETTGGVNRFKPPVPKTPWTGIHNGSQLGMPCPQIGSPIGGDEDCLNVNVFTRELPFNGSVLKPVMFWIYGGAYISGTNRVYGPDMLITHDVVLVATNYRLGIFGFLSTGDEAAYGNQALKDQVLALEWVRDNIAVFGGDPNKVTVFGQSAGASSTHYLQISPLATGLFHQIIVMSGCAVNPWTITRNPLPYIQNLATHFGINTDTTDAMIAGLQQIDPETLLFASVNSSITGYVNHTEVPPFFPVIEPDHLGAFVSQSGLQMLEAGNYNHVPYIFGHVTSEGAFGFKYLFGEFFNIEDLDTIPEIIVSPSLNGPDDPHAVGVIVRDYFLGPNVSALADLPGVMDLLTHEFFLRGIRKTIDIQRFNEEGYFYRFSYEGGDPGSFPGVEHGGDVQYIWYLFQHNYTIFSPADWLESERYTKLFTNFAKFGNPTPDADSLFNNVIWPKVTATDIGFLDIGVDLVPGSYPNETEYQFWTNLFNTYGKPPFITY